MPEPKSHYPISDHEEAMHLISAAAGVTTLSYEEAVAVYLRARHILQDGERTLGAPIPAGWVPGHGLR